MSQRRTKQTESKVIFLTDNSNILKNNTDVIYKCNECDYEIEFFNENLLLSRQMHVQETYHIDTIRHKRELEERKIENDNLNKSNRDKRSKENEIDVLEEKWSKKRVNLDNIRNNFEYQNLSAAKCCRKTDVIKIFDMFPNVVMINNWGYDEAMKAEKEKLKEQRYEMVLESLKTAINQFYPHKFTIEMFGSRITGLATENTNDMDVYINTGGQLNNPEAQGHFLSQLATILLQPKRKKKKATTLNIIQTEIDKWRQVVYIKNTRTPIIKAKLEKCDMSCDISVKNSLSVVNTELLKSLFQHVPIMQQIIFILREWKKNWNWTKQFTNYAISMMILFYLQNEKVLPSVYSINKQCVKIRDENGFPVYDYKKHDELIKLKKNQEKMSLVEHLYKFFKFYTKFNYETDVICPYMGCILKRVDFENNGLNLPEEMKYYKIFVSNMNNEECLYDTPIVLQDPIEQSHNITRNIRKSELEQFKTMCELSCLALGDRVLQSTTI